MSDPVGILLLGSVLGSVFSAVVYGVRAWARSEERRIDEVWRRAATSLKGKFEARSDGRQLRAAINGLEVVVDETLAGRIRNIRVRVNAAHTIGFAADVHRADALHRAFADARVTDDPAFDGDFVVETNRPALARIWLDASSRSAIRAVGSWKLHLEGGSLTLVHPETGAMEAPELARAIRSSAVVAQRVTRLANDWNALARKLGGVVSRPFAFERNELAAMMVAHDTTEAKLAIAHDLSAEVPIVTTFVDALAAVKHDAATQSTFTQRAVELGAQTLRFADGRVRLELEGVVTDGTLLRKVLGLVFEAAAPPSVGPYR